MVSLAGDHALIAAYWSNCRKFEAMRQAVIRVLPATMSSFVVSVSVKDNTICVVSLKDACMYLSMQSYKACLLNACKQGFPEVLDIQFKIAMPTYEQASVVSSAKAHSRSRLVSDTWRRLSKSVKNQRLKVVLDKLLTASCD